MSQHQSYAAKVLAGFFGLIVLVISSTTSFGFFYTFFDALVPPSVIDPGLGALISGMVGALLFDIACAIWLYIFLHHAETPEQRGISLIMAVVTFVGAAAASVAYLALTATGELMVDATTKDSIATLALVIVIIGVVSNFGAMQAYQRYSFQNKQKVREADRRDAVQKAEDEGAKYLDDLLGQRVKEKLEGAAEGLAEAQAGRILEHFYRQESAKYSRTAGEKSGNGRGTVLPGAPLKPRSVPDYEDTEAAAPVMRPRDYADTQASPPPSRPQWKLNDLLDQMGMTADQARETARRYNLTSPPAAWNRLKAFGYIPDEMARADFLQLYNELMGSRSSERFEVTHLRDGGVVLRFNYETLSDAKAAASAALRDRGVQMVVIRNANGEVVEMLEKSHLSEGNGVQKDSPLAH